MFFKSCWGLGLRLLASAAIALPAIALPAIALPPMPHQPEPGETQLPEQSAKITFDLSELSAEGLTLQSDRSIDYEFCIPDTEAYQTEVKAIDPSVQLMYRSRGRIGCRPDQVLCIGNTHQANWREILANLTNLDYVERIDQTFWE